MQEHDDVGWQSRVHRFLILLGIGVLLFSIFQFVQLTQEWTAWGMAGRSAAVETATPTPTKTPEPPRALPSLTPQRLARVVLPSPTVPALPPPTPTPVPTRPAPPEDIVAVAREHHIDTTGRYIVVDQARQRMFVVDGPVLVRVLPISTGDPQRHLFTPAWVGRVGVYWGTFSAHGVSADNAWHLFKAPGGNILIHGLPYTTDASGRKIYQDMDKLGNTPASRGCIRLRPDDAVWFTKWGPAGVPIVILPHPLQQR